MQIKKLATKMQIALNMLFLVIMLPLIIMVSITNFKETKERSVRELSNNTMSIYNMTSLYVNTSVENRLRAIAEKTKAIIQVNYNKVLNGEMEKDEAYRLSKELILNPVYGKIGITGYMAGISDNGILSIHPHSEGVDASGLDFMKEAVSRKNGFIEYEWKNKDETVPRLKVGYMSYFEPWDIIVWASSYKTEFNYLIDIDLLKDTFRKIKTGASGQSILFDKEGSIIYHSAKLEGNMLQGSSESEGMKEFVRNADNAFKEPGLPFYFEYSDNDSDTIRSAAIVYYDVLEWYIVSSTTNEEIYGTVNKITRLMAIISIIAFIAMIWIIYFLLKMFLAPLQKVREIINNISIGDLTGEIDVSTIDEIGTISNDVNLLNNGLRDVFSRMQKDIETLDLSVQDLSSSSNEIATTSNEQASAVREIVSTMEDSESLTKSIEKMIEKVSGISIKISEMITSGLNNVVKSQDKMAEIKVSNDDSITGIRFLSEKIEAIWEIVSIINSIADQTKIIAFNAELEASAAGEAGKNFQIVASEIRRLADSTVNSTSEIKSRIKEIQHSSDSLITSSEDGTNKIKEGGDLVTTLYRTFEEIMTTSQMSADSAKEITFSVRQMVESFEQILLTLKQISEGINNFVVTTKSTSEISQNLKGISDQMTEFLDFYKINNTEESE